jgi:uncharacterized protein YecE (DUF72 family)
MPCTRPARDKGVERFWQPLAPLRESGKPGPLLWQLSPNFERDEETLAAALRLLPEGARHCFEFRHPSWFNNDWQAFAPRNALALRGARNH